MVTESGLIGSNLTPVMALSSGGSHAEGFSGSSKSCCFHQPWPWTNLAMHVSLAYSDQVRQLVTADMMLYSGAIGRQRLVWPLKESKMETGCKECRQRCSSDFEPQVVMQLQSLFLGLTARIECRRNDCAASSRRVPSRRP